MYYPPCILTVILLSVPPLNTPAKVEEEMKEKNKETKPKTENVAKEKEETYKHNEAKEGRKSPTKHGHHKRKEHSVKIKIPFEKDDTRKRRHSSHRRSQDDEVHVQNYCALSRGRCKGGTTHSGIYKDASPERAGLEIKKILTSPFGDQLEKYSRQM